MHAALKWVTFLIAFAFAWAVMQSFKPYLAMHKAPTLDGKVLHGPWEVRQRFDALNDEHFLPNYREQESSVDLVFPLAYGLTFVLPVLFLAPGARAPRSLVIIPLITVVADYTENVTAMALCKIYPSDFGHFPIISTIASVTKWFTLYASVLLVIVLAVLWPFRRSGARERAA
jgi:hypothetical protein